MEPLTRTLQQWASYYPQKLRSDYTLLQDVSNDEREKEKFHLCCERGPKSHVTKEISGTGRRRSREKGNQGVEGLHFKNILQLFFIYFFSITLSFFLYFFYPRHLPTPTPTPTPTTHNPRPLPTTQDPRHLGLVQTPYFSCAEPNWISSTLERRWRDIWFRRRTLCRT